MKSALAPIIFLLGICFEPFSILHAQVSRDELKEVIQAFEESFQAKLDENAQFLVVNEPLAIKNWDWYESPILNASYVQYIRNGITVHSITIMGGLLKIKGVTQDTAALILCHELGHGIGGPPLKNQNAFTDYETSTEAQADYFSTFICAPKIWSHLHPEKIITSSADRGRCSKSFPFSDANFVTANDCRRSFEALKGFVEYQARVIPNFATSSFEASDPSIALTLINDYDYYPSPQCRLDTLMNGALQKDRPTCWLPVKRLSALSN